MSVVELNNVSVGYMIGDIKDIGLKDFVINKIKGNYNVKYFMSIDDVSFSLEKGDLLGIVGSNGAGKSTLLRTIAGIMAPTGGTVKTTGNVAALLELGVGFDPELTVKENTYLRGAMLGYSKAFMNQVYQDIIGFAELEEFVDRPYKQLSSGMKSRLAFSVASFVKPDILILDEVLSVGDGKFRIKSEQKMLELIHSGATTILVSHSLDQIKSLCNKVLWLNRGKQVAFGDVDTICNMYQEFLNSKLQLNNQNIIPSQRKKSYLIVGAGLFGATFANQMTSNGRKCVVLDRRSLVGGNAATVKMEDIYVHKYGAHIFHTDKRDIWNYVNQFADFQGFINAPIAVFGNQRYNLPFNMNTFHQLWGVNTPEEAKAKIAEQVKAEGIIQPKNLEEQALSMVGRDIYERLIKGYTEKQWGRPCSELPAEIIKRIPLRFVYDNNYFNDRWQGIPIGGYTAMVEKMLSGTEVHLNKEYKAYMADHQNFHGTVIYTGAIDEYFNYCYGPLEYRSLRFETAVLDQEDHQGNAVMNYTSSNVPYTRIIEHKHFQYNQRPKTVITQEYPEEWKPGRAAFYPINNEKNTALYQKYKELEKYEDNIIFCGRLGEYRYYDMDDTIAAAIKLADEQL